MIALARIIFAIMLAIGIASPMVAATVAGVVGLGLSFLPSSAPVARTRTNIPREWLDALEASKLRL